MSSKKQLAGQFYTTRCDYILNGLPLPLHSSARIIEPFAGTGDLLTWLEKNATATDLPIEAYDIEPKRADIVQRDTLMHPPNYSNAFVITNPPYLARNKCQDKTVFDKYDTNDLYKCFMHSVLPECAAGIFIIPAGIFLSPRDIDARCRSQFLTNHRLLQVKYFEETVFEDTPTTVVAVAFERSPVQMTEQLVEWVSLPSGARKTFQMRSEHGWIIGGDIYDLPVQAGVKVFRHVEGHALKAGEQLTEMTLCALDSGTEHGRICLEYKPGYTYPAKDCSRSYATLCIHGATLTPAQQERICNQFNELIEKKRQETWSLFLPQYRESKEYARKRIPFDLAYRIVQHLMMTTME
jgi:hypothetical protein